MTASTSNLRPLHTEIRLTTNLYQKLNVTEAIELYIYTINDVYLVCLER